TVLEAYFRAISAYAFIIYFVTRARQHGGLRVHLNALGLLGLTGGGVFFAFGSIGFLSAAYWLRQSHRNGGMRCVRDNGHVVAFGQDSFVCTSCSRLVRLDSIFREDGSAPGSDSYWQGYPCTSRHQLCR